MTNTEIIPYLIVAYDLIGGLVGFAVLSIGYAIVRRIENYKIGLIILGIGMVLGWVFFMNLDAAMMYTMALFVGVPLTLLVPLAILPCPEKFEVPLINIIPCYLLVWAVSALAPVILVGTKLSDMPFIYWHTPFSNALVYGVLMVVDIGIAGIGFRVLGLKPSLNPAQEI